LAIWRKDATHDWSRVAVVPPHTTTFTDTGLTPGTTYTYRVRATNNSGASDWSNEVTVTTPAGR
jgi:chitodextrinase